MSKASGVDGREMAEGNGITRRTWLGGAALAVGGGAACLMATRAAAQAKTSQQAAQYQDKPKDGKQCSGCTNFEAPSSCKVVDGKISPNGYCLLFVAKAG